MYILNTHVHVTAIHGNPHDKSHYHIIIVIFSGQLLQ